MAPLTEKQKELLTAFADGEVTDTERLEATELLDREDAQAYLDEVQALGDLVHKHGPVRAPVGLSGRVMSELESEFKTPDAPQAGPGEEPFHGPITFNWRTPMYAAAAAIVVSLAIMFVPGLITPSDDPASTVAREALQNLPPDAEDESGETVFDSTVEHSFLEKPEGMDGEYRSQDEVLEHLNTQKRGSGKGSNKKWGKGDSEELKREYDEFKDSPDGLHARRLRGEKNDVEEPEEKSASSGKEGLKEEGDQSAPDRDAQLEQDKDGERKDRNARTTEKGIAGATGGGGSDGKSDEGGRNNDADNGLAEEDPQDSRTKLKTDKPQNDSSENARPDPKSAEDIVKDAEEAGEESSPGAPTEGEASPLPPAPETEAPPVARRPSQSVETVTLALPEAEGLIAQNDVLWVSSLHGEAEIDEDADGNESVAVEIEADKLDELLIALGRLADDQGYGELEGGQEGALAGQQPDAADAKAERSGISGYVPEGDEAGAVMARNAGAAKIRVVIRLK